MASGKWVDSNWSSMADLTDNITGKIEVKSLFFDEKVEVSKEKRR